MKTKNDKPSTSKFDYSAMKNVANEHEREGLDVALGGWLTGEALLLRGRGNGSFFDGTPLFLVDQPSALDAVDLDGDGNLDLLGGGDFSQGDGLGPTLAWARGHGNGLFDPARTLGPTHYVSALATPDLDGDGRPDIIAAETNNGIEVLLSR